MSAISVTAASVLASSSCTPERAYNFGATFMQGQSGYLDANGVWQLADANVAACYGASLYGISLNAGSSGQPAAFATYDPAFNPGATLIVGQTYCVGATAGSIVPISDLTTGDAPIILFVATTASSAVLKPVSGGAVKP